MSGSVGEAVDKLMGKEAGIHFTTLSDHFCKAATALDDRLSASGYSRLSLVLFAFFLGYLIRTLKWLISDHVDPFPLRVRNAIVSVAKSLPPVKKYIDKELGKAKANLDKKKCTDLGNTPEEKQLLAALPRLPEEGLTSKGVMARLDAYSRILANGGKIWKNSKVSGAVYHIRKDLDDLAVEVFNHQLHANPLHFDVFGDARRCEAELVAWVWRMYNGPSEKQPCGVITSGGTESIALAVLACRNRALQRGVRWPEIVCCATAHVAVQKAAEMFRVRVVKVKPTWPDGTANVNAMRRAINSSTCMLYASAPGFPWGVIDSVAQISELGRRYDIPVHVDCCLGGFLAPFAEEAGFPMLEGPVDFRNKGVTTISVDTHKYGFAPKGSSVLLYRDSTLRNAQLFVAADWPGGVYATPSLSGSRSGAIVVCAWASALRVGYNGYVKATKGILGVADELRKRIPKIPGLKLLGRGELCVVAFQMADKKMANAIYLVYDRMTVKGWHINALQYPSGVHIAITDAHVRPGFADEFIENLESATKDTLEAIKSGKENLSMGSAAVYGTCQTIPDPSIVVDFAKQVIEDALSV